MKSIKIIIALAVVIICVGVATKLGDGSYTPLKKDDVKNKTTIYYVPVTSYFSKSSDVSNTELKKENIIYLASDKEILANYIDAQDVPTSSVEELVKKIQKGNTLALFRWDLTTPNMKTLSYEGKYLWDKDDFKDYALKTEVELTEPESTNLVFDAGKLTKINFLGDIMLSRHVNTQMTRNGFDYPWEKVKKVVADADLTFANLEVPISDMRPAPAEGMSFIAPTKNLAYLKEAGIDVVSVANNHTANFGTKAFTDNLTNLKKAGIGVCGGGLTEAESRTPWSATKNGTKFSFLCQSAITGSLYADGNNPGVPYLGIEPWYRDDRNSLNNLLIDIKKVVAKEGVVITSPHWGVEYKHTPNSSQQMVARLMVDSGVDLVVGTHPHVVQSSEFYHGKYITYSLGNFIFDQEWSEATKQGVMASGYFYANKNMAVNLVPLQIENYAQPHFVTDSVAKVIIGAIKNGSLGF